MDAISTYDYIVNNLPDCIGEMDTLTANLLEKDTEGKYLASSARFLYSTDGERYRPWIDRLIEGAIEKDRERRYIGGLLEAIWGEDYRERAEELSKTDDNFRRIYKRIFSQTAI